MCGSMYTGLGQSRGLGFQQAAAAGRATRGYNTNTERERESREDKWHLHGHGCGRSDAGPGWSDWTGGRDSDSSAPRAPVLSRHSPFPPPPPLQPPQRPSPPRCRSRIGAESCAASARFRGSGADGGTSSAHAPRSPGAAGAATGHRGDADCSPELRWCCGREFDYSTRWGWPRSWIPCPRRPLCGVHPPPRVCFGGLTGGSLLAIFRHGWSWWAGGLRLLRIRVGTLARCSIALVYLGRGFVLVSIFIIVIYVT